jgi:hypothetical protein
MVYQEDVIKIALHYTRGFLPAGIFCVNHELAKDVQQLCKK